MRNVVQTILLSLLVLAGQVSVWAQGPMGLSAHDRFPEVSGDWARRTLRAMSTDQKIGQLFMVPAYTNQLENRAALEHLIRDEHIGGIIFMQGTAERQVDAVNHYQQLAAYPLLMAQDAEWGLAMRLSGQTPYPKNLTLGAITQDSLLYAYGKQLAQECLSVGVQVNFAPVVDVNNNPNNPVINVRAFGDNKHVVARRALMLMQGMQAGGVMAVAKHFPGHGDTDVDSHVDLPTVPHKRKRLEELELYPFAQLIRAGVQGVMVAHLFVPELDNTPNQPTTLSQKVGTDMLRDSLGFTGLVFTDALNMGGVTKHYPSGEASAKALLAGNDVLLFPGDIRKARQKIKAALATGELTQQHLDDHVYRILLAKEHFKLHQNRSSPPDAVAQLENSPSGEALRRKLYRGAMTLVSNQNGHLPIRGLERQQIAYVQVGYNRPAPFFRHLKTYTGITPYVLPRSTTTWQVQQTVGQLKQEGYTQVIVGVFEMSHNPPYYGISSSTLGLFQQLKAASLPYSVALFGSPYGVDLVTDEQALIVAYEEALPAQQAAAEVFFGGYEPTGRLPVEVGRLYRPNSIRYPLGEVRFGFSSPAEMGFDEPTLARIDTICNNYVRAGAMPGIAIGLLRGNQVVFAKGYGQSTYADNARAIDPYESVYDIASVTKVAATTLAVMRLHEQGKISMNDQLRDYFPELKKAELGKLRLNDILLHQAGLMAHWPFHILSQAGKEWNPNLIRAVPDDSISVAIGPNVYLHQDFTDTLFRKLFSLPVARKPTYVYSDLDMIVMGKLVERVTGQPLDEYVEQEFYAPMGMSHTLFNPAQAHRTDLHTPPTVVDTYFRHRRIQGYVNDDNAAVLGGVAGHAGLFSNVYDLMKLGLMLKNEGQYGGTEFFVPTTVKYFTRKADKISRRGLGFDKPETHTGRITPTSRQAHPSTFGHLGFTGTAWWVDPQNDLVLVILSNRTYPDPNERRMFSNEAVRTQLMDVVYRSLQVALQQPDGARMFHPQEPRDMAAQ